MKDLPGKYLTKFIFQIMLLQAAELCSDTSFSVMSRTRLPARSRGKCWHLVSLNEPAVYFTTGWQPRSTRQVPPVTEKLVF